MDNVISGKVLIVEDSPLDRKLLMDILKDEHLIMEAQNGKGALELISQEVPDLILLDIQMPGMDGFEICKRIKGNPELASVPVIFLTVTEDTPSKVKAFEAGAADYIVKPFMTNEVKARVNVHLRIREYEQGLEKEKLALLKSFHTADQKLKDFAAQLVQTEKMAAIGEITAGVAHELKQPLNVMKIICQSILKDIEKERFDLASAKQDLPELLSQMNRMAQIIDHMRVFSRRTVGNTIEEININETIDSVFVFLGQQLMNHNVAVDKQYTVNIGKVKGDSIRLEQVFMNIITNARQALLEANKQAMKIEIKTYMSPDGKSVIAELKDNGPGILPENMENIFEAFFTTKQSGEGTGLGLSTARKIVEEHAGILEVESVPGEWTLFRVILPVSGESK